MFTWTCKRLWPWAIVLGLGGCDAALFPSQTGEPVPLVTLAHDVKVQGPTGYCVDPETRKRNAVVLFSCARLKDADAADPTEGYMYTAASLKGGITNPKEFATYLKSDVGQAILSANNNPDQITIHRVRTTARAVYVHYTDAGRPAHLGQRAWRGFVGLGEKTAIIGVYSGAGDPVTESAIRDFAQSIVAATAADG